MHLATVFRLALSAISLAVSAALNLSESSNVLSFPVRRAVIGETPALPMDYGLRWVADINLGGQDFRVQIDTGSHFLWTLSTFMPPEEQESLPNHRWYNVNASLTWQPTSIGFDAYYGDGSHGIQAIAGYERVNMSGISTVMQIGAAKHSTELQALISNDSDGILGMAFGEQDKNGKVIFPTFMMAIQEQLAEPIFTLEVHENVVGSLNLGFVDKTKYGGALFELPVNNRTRSLWDVDNVSVGSNGKNLSSKALPLLFDTGGLFTTLPTATAAAYWAQVDGAVPRKDGFWGYPCNASTPDLTLLFPSLDASAKLPGSMINSIIQARAGGNRMCIGGVRGHDDLRYINVGKAFFLTYFTVWNQAKPSISFAPYSYS